MFKLIALVIVCVATIAWVVVGLPHAMQGNTFTTVSYLVIVITHLIGCVILGNAVEKEFE